jgi:hypothetical protein
MPDFKIKINSAKQLDAKSHVLNFPIHIEQEFIDSIIAESTIKQMTEYLTLEKYQSIIKIF